MKRSATAASSLALTVAFIAGGCASHPAPSHVAAGYRGKLLDDTLVEASTTVLVTTAPAIIGTDCRSLRAAIRDSDEPAVDSAVRSGEAARLPAGVTIYTPPFSTLNPESAPFVVTDDKYGGSLCTPRAVKVVTTE